MRQETYEEQLRVIVHVWSIVPNHYVDRRKMNTEIIIHPKLQHYGLITANLDTMLRLPELL